MSTTLGMRIDELEERAAKLRRVWHAYPDSWIQSLPDGSIGIVANGVEATSVEFQQASHLVHVLPYTEVAGIRVCDGAGRAEYGGRWAYADVVVKKLDKQALAALLEAARRE